MNDAVLPPGRPSEPEIDSRDAFHAALLDALHSAAEAGCPELWFCDRDFLGWPLGAPAVVDALGRWAGSRRSLTLLAADFDGFARTAPRWHAWRRTWSHIVHCHAVHEDVAGSVPTLVLAAPRLAIRLHDRVRHRGRIHRESGELAACREQIDALMQRASGALPVTTLGL